MDIVIVGAGICGLSLVLNLHQRGIWRSWARKGKSGTRSRIRRRNRR
jgi:glycine/D-amino acid oxidase-like deaminating enzyme